jgi:hypothetical protein
MRIRTNISLAVFMLTLWGSVVADGQESKGTVQAEHQFNASCRLANGLHVAFANETVPTGSIQFSLSMVETQGSDVIHRVFLDESRRFFFGYDVKVEPVPNTRQIRVFILPMSVEYEQRLREHAAFHTRGVSPDFTSPSLFQTESAQLVNEGDVLAIDALVNQSTGVKIVEIIKASREEIPLGSSPARTPIHDFSLDDVELGVTNYRLLIDGELVAGDRPTGGCSGAIIWFYLPDRGRFILSIRPHEGYDFQKIGLIENNKIKFTFGREEYQWISTAAVTGSNGRFNLWVLHDTNYRPELDEGGARLMRRRGRNRQAGSSSGLLVGAADRIEYLFSRTAADR